MGSGARLEILQEAGLGGLAILADQAARLPGGHFQLLEDSVLTAVGVDGGVKVGAQEVASLLATAEVGREPEVVALPAVQKPLLLEHLQQHLQQVLVDIVRQLEALLTDDLGPLLDDFRDGFVGLHPHRHLRPEMPEQCLPLPLPDFCSEKPLFALRLAVLHLLLPLLPPNHYSLPLQKERATISTQTSPPPGSPSARTAGNSRPATLGTPGTPPCAGTSGSKCTTDSCDRLRRAGTSEIFWRRFRRRECSSLARAYSWPSCRAP
jgi:hypothetical protein